MYIDRKYKSTHLLNIMIFFNYGRRCIKVQVTLSTSLFLARCSTSYVVPAQYRNRTESASRACVAVHELVQISTINPYGNRGNV